MEKMPDNLLPYEGEIHYFPNFFTEEDCGRLFSYLKSHVQWKQEPIKIFGREIMQPRLTALYGDPLIPYRYSGIQMQALPFSEELLEIKTRLEKIAEVNFTHVLINYYRDGKDSMGWHRDNEKSLGHLPVIGSVSFGAPRLFQIRHYKNKDPKINLPLENGSFLLMRGSSQQYWEHQVPKTKTAIGERVNLTFRVITN